MQKLSRRGCSQGEAELTWMYILKSVDCLRCQRAINTLRSVPRMGVWEERMAYLIGVSSYHMGKAIVVLDMATLRG